MNSTFNWQQSHPFRSRQDGWNPVNDIESVIVSIRSLLVVGDGRLQTAYEMNESKYQARLKASKHDVKDGFYRMFLNALDCLKLAALLPRHEGEPQLVGIPMPCTMGWAQSPPSFCAM